MAKKTTNTSTNAVTVEEQMNTPEPVTEPAATEGKFDREKVIEDKPPVLEMRTVPAPIQAKFRVTGMTKHQGAIPGYPETVTFWFVELTPAVPAKDTDILSTWQGAKDGKLVFFTAMPEGTLDFTGHEYVLTLLPV